MALDVGTLSLLSLGGNDFLADLEDATLEIGPDMTKRIDSITRAGQAEGTTKRGCHFEISLLSTKSTPERVSHLDLTAFTIGGTDYIANLESLDFSGSYEQKDKPAAGQLWQVKQNVTKKYTASVNLAIPDTGGMPLLVNQTSATLSNQNAALAFTLNGNAFSFAMRSVKVSAPWQRDGLQMVTVDFVGRDPGTGAFPSAPTGTTGLLQLALNAFKTPLAFDFISHATEGYELSGNVIYSGFSFQIKDGELVPVKYSFDSTGTVVGAAT